MGKRGRNSGSVCIDRYAVENAMMANETNAAALSQRLGHASTYLSQVFRNGCFMRREDFDNLKGILRVKDADIKAIPIQRSDEVESIYQPVPVAKSASRTFVLNEENNRYVDFLVNISGVDKTTLINGIIRDYFDNSEIVKTLNETLDKIGSLIK
jgi:hypothetical protein